MKKVSKLLFIIPFILILFACGKKTTKTNKITENTTKDNVTTKDNSKYHNVSFFNYDNSLIKTIKVKEGEKPVYDGDIPVKNANLGYEYDFLGWGPSLTETFSDTNYFAQFSDLKVKKEMQNFIFESTRDKCSIKGIKDNTVTSIVVPEYVTSIDQGSFKNCSSLVSITIPFVGDKAHMATDTYQYPLGYIFGTASYDGGIATTQYYYGSSLESPTNTTYYIPKSLKEVTITGSSHIQYGAFRECIYLTSVGIPNSVTSIGEGAFYRCDRLANVYYDGTIENWCLLTLDNSSSNPMCAAPNYFLPKLYLLDSNGDIEYNGKKYSLLTELVISNSITSIGGYAFYGCTSLTSIEILNSVTSIGRYAFCDCINLATITNASSITNIDTGAFQRCSSLTSITLSNNITSIGSLAFDGCSSLISIIIPNSVTSINNYTFRNCSSLTSIVIPSSVVSIGNSVFSGCNNLANVYYQGDSNQWDNLTIGSSNTYLDNATKYYYSETEPEETGKYWHYVNDEVVIWE